MHERNSDEKILKIEFTVARGPGIVVTWNAVSAAAPPLEGPGVYVTLPGSRVAALLAHGQFSSAR